MRNWFAELSRRSSKSKILRHVLGRKQRIQPRTPSQSQTNFSTSLAWACDLDLLQPSFNKPSGGHVIFRESKSHRRSSSGHRESLTHTSERKQQQQAQQGETFEEEIPRKPPPLVCHRQRASRSIDKVPLQSKHECLSLSTAGEHFVASFLRGVRCSSYYVGRQICHTPSRAIAAEKGHRAVVCHEKLNRDRVAATPTNGLHLFVSRARNLDTVLCVCPARTPDPSSAARSWFL